MARSDLSKIRILSKYIYNNKGLKIGLMGGSFNPPHNGHLKIAKLAIKNLNLDEVWWLVSTKNPLKTSKGLMSLSRRVELTKKIANHPKFKVLNIENNLKTKNSYDLLKKILPRLSNMKLIWIMGSDNLFNFSKWYKAKKISNLIPFAVFNRRGSPLRSINSKGAYVLGKRINSSRLKLLSISEPPIWGYFHNVNINISSTIIRGSKE